MQLFSKLSNKYINKRMHTIFKILKVRATMKTSVLYFVLTLYFFSKCDAEDMPPFIHVCHRDDPKLGQCMITAAEDLRPYLVTGVPEYEIPSLEPLVLHDLISEEAAGLKISTYNVSAYGCSEFFVRNVNFNTETMLWDLDVDLPKLRIEAHYSIDGKLLLLPVKGDGNLEANVTDCISKAILQGELFEKDGEKYLKFNSFDLKVKVGGGHVRLENLFNGDKVLLGIINDVVNKNLDTFLKELMPAIEKGLSCTFLDIANKVVGRFTFKQLFPH